MDLEYQQLLDRIKLLEWKVEVLQDNVTCKSFFNIMLEMNITREQHSQIVIAVSERPIVDGVSCPGIDDNYVQ